MLACACSATTANPAQHAARLIGLSEATATEAAAAAAAHKSQKEPPGMLCVAAAGAPGTTAECLKTTPEKTQAAAARPGAATSESIPNAHLAGRDGCAGGDLRTGKCAATDEQHSSAQTIGGGGGAAAAAYADASASARTPGCPGAPEASSNHDDEGDGDALEGWGNRPEPWWAADSDGQPEKLVLITEVRPRVGTAGLSHGGRQTLDR
eukprot:1157284-Pelagomonas_calceolata.AAC.4